MKKFNYALLVLVFSFTAFAVVSSFSSPATAIASSHSKSVHSHLVFNDNHNSSQDDNKNDSSDKNNKDDNKDDSKDDSKSHDGGDDNHTPAPTTATIHATKIVCNSESDLPNWGAGGPDITSSTAATFLSAHSDCHSADWTFEWAPDGTANPGDQTDVAGGVWTAFSGSTSVPSGASIWVREEFKDGYIPFSGWLSNGHNTPNDNDKNSAELYCNNDVLNYDNYDFVNPIVAGKTYNCIGFNVSTTPTPTDVCPNIDGDQAEVPAGDYINTDGNCVPTPVTTIDNTCPVPSTLDDSTTETVHAAPGAELNLQTVLNNQGYSLDVQTDQKQFQSWNVDANSEVNVDATYVARYASYNSVFGYYTDGDTSNFVPVFKTTNITGYESTPLSSAGPFTISTGSASTIGFAIKVFNGSTAAGTIATQNSLNSGSHDQVVVYNPSSNTYVLGFEDVVGGDYDFNDLVVKVALGCSSIGNENDAPVADAGPDQNITLPTDSITLDGSGSTDSDGTISSYVWTEVSGPSTVDPDDTVSTSASDLIEGTYVFELTVTDNDGATGTDTVTITVNPIVVGGNPQCSDGADNDGDNLIDSADPGCHTDGIPTHTETYNPNDNDETNVPECSNTGDDDSDGLIDAADPGCHTDGDVTNTSSYDPNDNDETNDNGGGGSNPQCSDGVDNDGDNLVDSADPGCHTDGDVTNTSSYDPNDNNETDVVTHHSGGSSHKSGGTPVGQVLAAENTCGIYVQKYLRVGYANDVETVKKVQTFLNDYMNAGLTVDGIYGVQTETAVRTFQVSHADKVLAPWGINNQSTGIFYLTTQTEVNNIMCPTLGLPIPSPLINFSQNANTPAHVYSVVAKGPVKSPSSGVNI